MLVGGITDSSFFTPIEVAAMTPIARDICNELLSHHRNVCVPHTFNPPIVDQCVIAYGVLCRNAGHPEVMRIVGHFLQEIAQWCYDQSPRFPPLNALAINDYERQPGENYNVAPGCSLIDWANEVVRTIQFRGYPHQVP